jgi:competence protein ComGC
MKRAMLIVFILLFISIPVSVSAAGSTTVKEADISVDSSSSTQYTLVEKVTLTNIENREEGTIAHTFSNFKNSEISNLEVATDGQELQYEWEKGDSLHKLHVRVPEQAEGEFTYTLKYELALEEDSFTTPLFVPMYPAPGTTNVVHLEFNAPEGEVIQKNSFPVLTKEVGNEVKNDMMNIPSHVKYVYGETSNPFNAFNLISWGVVAALISIIVLWFRAELTKKKEAAA